MESRHIYIFLFLAIITATAFSFFTILNDFSITGLTTHTNETIINPFESETATKAEVTSLKNIVTSLQQRISSLESSSEITQQEITRLNGNIQNLKSQVSQLQQTIEQQSNSVSTGLAGLQNNLEETKNEFSTHEKEVQKRRTRNFSFFLILLTTTIIFGLYSYKKGLFHSNHLKINHKIMDYITDHVKKGNKYSHIKTALVNAGWLEDDIKKAYKATLKRNYHRYKKKKTGNKNKIIAIVGSVVILVSVITFFSFGTSTGQAYQKYGGVDDYEEGTGLNRVLSKKQCFPPRVLVRGECCDDRNSNGICDDKENFRENIIKTLCTDNSQCINGKTCINNECNFISDLYQTTNCNELCTVIRVGLQTENIDLNGKITMEEYTLRMGLGSYTGSGALDWTIKAMPDFCKSSSAERINQQSNTWRANIPIPLEVRELDNSNILGKKVITLNLSEEKTLKHRTLDINNFKIKVNDIHMTCGGESIFG